MVSEVCPEKENRGKVLRFWSLSREGNSCREANENLSPKVINFTLFRTDES